ncbi:MAG: tetratricopeptide repeat protein, partial [Bacteroidales bacterium]|nr:tetratricopeptide repeat protein [Bacteroidales bacterium]
DGKTKEAESSIEKFKSLRKENLKSEADIMTWLGWICSEAGILDNAEEYYRKALSFQPDSVYRKYNLTVFLILKNRSINEGVEILDEIIKSYPQVLQNYGFLDRYGWGSYKQGKYKEALDILQKSWNLRREKAIYNHEAYLHLEEAKKAVAGMKNN